MQGLKSAIKAARKPLSTRCFTAQAETYYSSQSGRVMRVPGSAGIRIHEVCCSEWKTHPSRIELLRKVCLAKPDTVELWSGAALELKKLGSWQDLPTKFTTRINHEEDLNYAAAHADIISFADIFVRCNSNTGDDLNSALKLMADARTGGLQVRAYVSDAFQSPDGVETDPATVQDTVVALADADAYSIIISDDNETSETDSLRYAVPSMDFCPATCCGDILYPSSLHQPDFPYRPEHALNCPKSQTGPNHPIWLAPLPCRLSP